MASPEASWSASDSVVTTRPRMREEVREELREEITLVEQARLPTGDKLRLERGLVETAEGEVEMFEKSWRRTSSETLPEIERAVDAMDLASLRPRAGPPPAPQPAPAPARDVASRTPARPVGKRLSPAEQRALAKHLGGQLVRAEVLFSTTMSRVVECAYKVDGQDRAATVILRDGHVETLEEIGTRLDGMPLRAPAPAPGAGVEGEGERPQDERAGMAPTEREPAPPPAADADEIIAAIEGIGPTFGAKLGAAGVGTLDALRAADAEQLAQRTGIQESLVRKWQAMADLQRLRGIGPQYSELLVRAGVEGAASLAGQDAEALAAKLNEYEASLGVRVQGNAISAKQTAEWIAEARSAAPGEKKKGFSLKLGKRKEEPAAAQAEAAPGDPMKKGFSLKLGKKPEAQAPAPPEPTEGAAEPEEPKKKGFRLSLGRK